MCLPLSAFPPCSLPNLLLSLCVCLQIISSSLQVFNPGLFSTPVLCSGSGDGSGVWWLYHCCLLLCLAVFKRSSSWDLSLSWYKWGQIPPRCRQWLTSQLQGAVNNYNVFWDLPISIDTSFMTTAVWLHLSPSSPPPNSPLSGHLKWQRLLSGWRNCYHGSFPPRSKSSVLVWMEGTAHPLLVWNDHKNLAYLRLAEWLNPRQACWALFLGHSKYTLPYCPGPRKKKKTGINALSCQFSISDKESPDWLILPPQCDVAAASTSPEWLTTQFNVVPGSTRSLVLQWEHSSNLAYQPGFQRVFSLIWQHYLWPSVYADTDELSMPAPSSSVPATKPAITLPLAYCLCHANSHITMDWVTGLPPSEGNAAILTIVDS